MYIDHSGIYFRDRTFGTSVVRKCASTLSVLILIGLVLVLVPNIIVQWDAITAAVSNLVSGKMPVISGESGAFDQHFIPQYYISSSS